MNEEETRQADVIRKAVELADGWKLEAHVLEVHGKDEPQHVSAYGCYLGHLKNTESRNPGFRKLVLDALAAQLVRQLEGISAGYWVETYPGGVTVCCVEKHRFPREQGEDRSVNTIRAIVDSKVLEDGADE